MLFRRIQQSPPHLSSSSLKHRIDQTIDQTNYIHNHHCHKSARVRPPSRNRGAHPQTNRNAAGRPSFVLHIILFVVVGLVVARRHVRVAAACGPQGKGSGLAKAWETQGKGSYLSEGRGNTRQRQWLSCREGGGNTHGKGIGLAAKAMGTHKAKAVAHRSPPTGPTQQSSGHGQRLGPALQRLARRQSTAREGISL